MVKNWRNINASKEDDKYWLCMEDLKKSGSLFGPMLLSHWCDKTPKMKKLKGEFIYGFRDLSP
jgi:hypothetical protein